MTEIRDFEHALERALVNARTLIEAQHDEGRNRFLNQTLLINFGRGSIGIPVWNFCIAAIYFLSLLDRRSHRKLSRRRWRALVAALGQERVEVQH